MQGWKALVAVASNEWRFCFFQLLQGRRGEGLGVRWEYRENTLKQLASGQVNLHHLPTPAELRIKHVTLLPFFCLTYKTVISTGVTHY